MFISALILRTKIEKELTPINCQSLECSAFVVLLIIQLKCQGINSNAYRPFFFACVCLYDFFIP